VAERQCTQKKAVGSTANGLNFANEQAIHFFVTAHWQGQQLLIFFAKNRHATSARIESEPLIVPKTAPPCSVPKCAMKTPTNEASNARPPSTPYTMALAVQNVQVVFLELDFLNIRNRKWRRLTAYA
jgi:hypothetical protein